MRPCLAKRLNSAATSRAGSSLRGPGGQRRGFSGSSVRQADFTHVVIGAGVIGLATASRLASRPNTTTLLLERHPHHGTETSSRNSEVIHAGIYYGPSSLKTKLCIRGRELLYAFCAKHDVPHAKLGKWIVAQTEVERTALEDLSRAGEALGVPTRWVSSSEAREKEPLVRAEAGILESPETGIVDSHEYMLRLLGEFENQSGILATNTTATQISPLGPNASQGWEIQVHDAATNSLSKITSETIINAAGLGAVTLHNTAAPKDKRLEMYYAKGNYFSCTNPRIRPSRLIYPAPSPGAAGLGTHLTLDLAGRVRFGPDVEWVEGDDDLAVDPGRVGPALDAIRSYLPGIGLGDLAPDYAGLRPKLSADGAVLASGKGAGFKDFVVRREEGFEGWLSLLGIESPGLTSSLAIAERVDGLLYGHGDGN